MEKSQTITKISLALFEFQSKAHKIIKKADNPFFKSKYADLPSILDEISEPLRDCGLVLSQHPDGEGLTTLLIHAASGEYFMSNGTMKPIKNDPQALGSAITYQRRYAICSILGLNVDKDDDGNEASQPQKPAAKAPSKEQPTKPWLNENTDAFIKALKYVKEQSDKEAAVKKIMAKYSISKAIQDKLKNG